MTKMGRNKKNELLEAMHVCASMPPMQFESFLIRNNFHNFPNRLQSVLAACRQRAVCLHLSMMDVFVRVERTTMQTVLIEKKQTKTREHVYFRVKLGSVAWARVRGLFRSVLIRCLKIGVCARTSIHSQYHIGLLFDFLLRKNIAPTGTVGGVKSHGRWRECESARVCVNM